MPDIFELDDRGRVRVPEGKTLEFKRNLSSPTGPLRTIVAFANSAGGRLAIGIDDDGTVVGVADPLAEDERIASLIADSIMPWLMPGIDLVPLGEKTVLVVDVPLSTGRPHYLASRGLADGTYVRLGSTNRKADASLIAEIERSARGIRFEDLADTRATLADIDLSVLPLVDGRRVDEADLIPLGLAVRRGEASVPTNAGLLAACPHPDRFMTSAWVQCGRIRGTNRTDIVDRMEYHGPMLGAVDAVMDFLRKNAFLSARFGDVRRKDVWSIPIEPLREVVVNALVHANYAEPGTPVRIAFYDDRIEVEGPGLLVAGMTIPGMRNASRLRNPSLARVFRAAGLMENFGTGVRRVYEQLAADGLPEPKVEEVIDRLRFTVYVPSHAPDAGLGADEKHQDRALRHQDEAPSQSVASLSSTEAVVLRQVRVDPASRAELMTALGITNQTRAFRRHIEPLLESGLLERTLPDKPTSRDQRYRITELGLVALAGQEDAE